MLDSMVGAKTMMTYMIDCGVSMGESAFEQDKQEGAGASPSKLQVAKECALDHMVARMTTVKTAEFSVVSFPSPRSDNHLAVPGGIDSGYEGISELGMAKPTAALVTHLDGLDASTSKNDKVDLVGALAVALDGICQYNPKLKFNRILQLLTDAEGFELDDEDCENLEAMLETMRERNVAFLVVVLDGGGDSGATQRVKKEENVKLLQSIADASGGGLVRPTRQSECIGPFDGLPGMGTRPQMLDMTLCLTKGSRVACKVWDPISIKRLPTFKKVLRAALNAPQADPTDVAYDAEFGKVEADKSYYVAARPREEVGDKSSLTKTYPYGADLIPIDDTLLAQFFWNADVCGKTLTTIGFVPISHIPRSHFMDKASVLQPHTDDPGSVTAMAALCDAMRNYSWKVDTAAPAGGGGDTGAPPDAGVGVGMLVRVQKQAASDPYLGVLMSQPTAYAAAAAAAADGSEEAFDLDALATLVLQRLPMREDVRDYLFPLLPNADTECSAEQKAAVAHMLDSITVRTLPTGGGGGGGLLVQDPTLVHYRRAVANALRGRPATAAAATAVSASAATPSPIAAAVVAASAQSHTLMTHKFDCLSLCESGTAKASLEALCSAFGIEVATGAAKAGATTLATGAIQLATTDSLATAAAAVPSKSPTDNVTGSGAVPPAASSTRPKLKLHSLAPEHDLDAVVQHCNRDRGANATPTDTPHPSAFEREQLLIEAVDTGLQIVQSRVASYHGPEAQRVAAGLLLKLRAVCTTEGLVDRFNDFLLEMFTEDEPDNIVFFDAYVGSGSCGDATATVTAGAGADVGSVPGKVCLITDVEDSVSIVSAAAAADFAHTRYDSVRAAAAEAAAAASAVDAATSTHTQPSTAMYVDGDVDDLFEDMD